MTLPKLSAFYPSVTLKPSSPSPFTIGNLFILSGYTIPRYFLIGERGLDWGYNPKIPIEFYSQIPYLNTTIINVYT